MTKSCDEDCTRRADGNEGLSVLDYATTIENKSLFFGYHTVTPDKKLFCTRSYATHWRQLYEKLQRNDDTTVLIRLSLSTQKDHKHQASEQHRHHWALMQNVGRTRQKHQPQARHSPNGSCPKIESCTHKIAQALAIALHARQPKRET